jgi:hypothetical protein
LPCPWIPNISGQGQGRYPEMATQICGYLQSSNWVQTVGFLYGSRKRDVLSCKYPSHNILQFYCGVIRRFFVGFHYIHYAA